MIWNLIHIHIIPHISLNIHRNHDLSKKKWCFYGFDNTEVLLNGPSQQKCHQKCGPLPQPGGSTDTTETSPRIGWLVGYWEVTATKCRLLRGLFLWNPGKSMDWAGHFSGNPNLYALMLWGFNRRFFFQPVSRIRQLWHFDTQMIHEVYPLVNVCSLLLKMASRNNGFTQLENGGSFHRFLVNVYQAGPKSCCTPKLGKSRGCRWFPSQMSRHWDFPAMFAMACFMAPNR